MDIKKFSVEPTARLPLLGSDDEPLLNEKGKELAIVFFGPGSKQYAKAQAVQNNGIVDRLKKKGKTDQTAEQKLAETSQFLADVTSEFENIDYDDLKDKALFKAVYSDLSLGFISDQASKFLGDWSNFKPPSVSS